MNNDDIDGFARLIDGKGLRLGVQSDDVAEPRRPSRTDALFHLPLLAASILVIAKLDALTTEHVGRRVAHLLIEYFHSLRDVGTLEWSITLRRRCAEALTFLEAAKLVEVEGIDVRIIGLTSAGKEVLLGGLREESDVGQLARGLMRAQSRSLARTGAA
jgi:hypothetical protein